MPGVTCCKPPSPARPAPWAHYSGAPAFAQSAAEPFPKWVETFRAKTRAKGISDATYTRVMGSLKPDESVFSAIRSQPEFNQQLWQYINRRVSDWRIQYGQERAKEVAPLLARIEKDFGVERAVILGLWGIESTFGDPLVKQNHSRPVFPALAALAWGEPRRRAYWETELINALRIVEKGWATPKDMVGSWAGAMGHTQWMPEVWLNLGLDYDGDGRVNPLDKPDDALGSSAKYLVNRGKYRRGEHWGYEVRAPGRSSDETSRTYEAWQALGVTRAGRPAVPEPEADCEAMGAGRGRAGVPARPEFLCGEDIQSVDELHARDRASRRPRARRAVRSCSPSRAASAHRPWPRCRRCRSASPPPASTPAAPTAASAT